MSRIKTDRARGGAMLELIIWMAVFAPFIHAMLHWSHQFSNSESYWAGEVANAHADQSSH